MLRSLWNTARSAEKDIRGLCRAYLSLIRIELGLFRKDVQLSFAVTPCEGLLMSAQLTLTGYRFNGDRQVNASLTEYRKGYGNDSYLDDRAFFECSYSLTDWIRHVNPIESITTVIDDVVAEIAYRRQLTTELCSLGYRPLGYGLVSRPLSKESLLVVRVNRCLNCNHRRESGEFRLHFYILPKMRVVLTMTGIGGSAQVIKDFDEYFYQGDLSYEVDIMSGEPIAALARFESSPDHIDYVCKKAGVDPLEARMLLSPAMRELAITMGAKE